MKRHSRRYGLSLAIACACAPIACASAPPPPPAKATAVAPVVTASAAPQPKPLDCQALCTKANTVAGCATDAANVPACVEQCTRMLAGACKAQVEAELACAAKITLACKPEGAVDWGACVAEQRAANECARASLP